MDKDRFCSVDEIWVCPMCGHYVEYDRYDFEDESCMLNAFKIARDKCEFDKYNRVREIKKEDKVINADELINAVKQWGDDRNLHDPVMQYAKVNEEIGEIAHELTRGHLNTTEMADAIGDSAVTLIILANILGLDFVDCLNQAYNEIKDRTGKTEKGTFIKDAA